MERIFSLTYRRYVHGRWPVRCFLKMLICLFSQAIFRRRVTVRFCKHLLVFFIYLVKLYLLSVY